MHVVGGGMGLKGTFWECLLLPAPVRGGFQTISVELCDFNSFIVKSGICTKELVSGLYMR